MATETATPPALRGLTHAFETFTAATTRLESEYAALRARVDTLTNEVEEKNRLLAASVERERRLEAEALRQSRLAAMGEMAAMLAHEVRNPLGAMELFTGLLLQDLREQPDALRLARQVAAGITDLNHLVTNLLEWTRTRTVASEVVDCCALVEDALRYTGDLRAAHTVRVERRYGIASIHASADANLLRPVLLNLIRNALQAMPDGGTLTVEVEASGGTVAIAIGDTGLGVLPGEEDLIFRPFYTTRAKGTGLGLAVVRELVGAMDGRLALASEPGRGAVFTVTVPGVDGA
ncbi:MAG TPA: ATP-binding protein [Candidatus Binatia bacterium]|jgi:two-component system sensor histidine kinase FlrB|nr:ATP-binding protein [Candidatus Binatia bacterium]